MRAMSGEIEIGRSKRARQAYSFDDIAVVPARPPGMCAMSA